MKKLFIILLLFSIDRFSKFYLINLQSNGTDIDFYIYPFLNIYLVWNTGIGFGFLSTNSNLIYNSITTIIGLIIFFLIHLIIKSKNIDKILFSLILGGAVGNFYDRLVYFAVPDFIDIHYNNFHWFTFNIADIFITIGVILLIIKELALSNE